MTNAIDVVHILPAPLPRTIRGGSPGFREKPPPTQTASGTLTLRRTPRPPMAGGAILHIAST